VLAHESDVKSGGKKGEREAGRDVVENRAVPCPSLSPRCSTSLYKYSVMSPCQVYYTCGVDKKRPTEQSVGNWPELSL